MTDYMGSVDRARAWMYRGDNSLIRYLQGNSASWRGFHTWLHPFFSSDIAIGFGFGKDETFLRWLFLERARVFQALSIAPGGKRRPGRIRSSGAASKSVLDRGRGVAWWILIGSTT
ncbi:hypothetical protein [Mesorhizobium sp.]|uniref:hypothetical protein n=1 Tax=Mesorhizobium sp. TaxID=1871066 RepID=UPI001204A8A9|nr:hypothetical protein [Mesorhizobium sp.]TIS98806.1 MAG: hypothetical protein E5W87_23670 [Mesorhizobium sp.]